MVGVGVSAVSVSQVTTVSTHKPSLRRFVFWPCENTNRTKMDNLGEPTSKRQKFPSQVNNNEIIEVERENVFNAKVNPLMNPFILETVLFFLPIPYLQSCRQVCTTWNSEVDRFFVQKVKKVEIRHEEFTQAENLLDKSKKNSVYLSSIECEDSSCYNPLFEKLVLQLGIHLHKIILSKCQVDVNYFLNLMLVNPFPNLAVLILKRTTYRHPQGKQTIFVPSENDFNESIFKSLRTLEIDEIGPNSQTSLSNITFMCPNLVRLAYGNCPPPNIMDFKPVKNKPSKLTLPSLEYLQLAPIQGKKMSFEYFKALECLELKSLKTIFLYGMDPGGEKRMKGLHNFLKSVSQSLESLHLVQRSTYKPEYQPKVASPFPVDLPNIKKMSLGPGFIHSMKFLDKIPNVVSFTCSRTKSNDWEKIVDKGVPKKAHEEMRCLDLGDISHISLEKLGPCFPNVVKLELNLSRADNHDGVVRAVFGGFIKLQTFSIYDLSNQNKLTDAGITGISNEECISMLKLPKKDQVVRHMHPYVGDLKQLIDLRLQYLSGKLTDASVLFGIKDLHSLCALDLSNSQITDLSLECIAENLPSLRILYIRNCPSITSQGVAKIRQEGRNIIL